MEYNKLYHNFKECEVLTYIDNEVIGEIENFATDSSKRLITFSIPMFTSIVHIDRILKNMNYEKSKLKREYANEYGAKVIKVFSGLSIQSFNEYLDDTKNIMLKVTMKYRTDGGFINGY